MKKQILMTPSVKDQKLLHDIIDTLTEHDQVVSVAVALHPRHLEVAAVTPHSTASSQLCSLAASQDG